MQALVIDGAVAQWPLLPAHIKSRGLPPDQVWDVTPTTKPVVYDIIQYVVERRPVIQDGILLQQWEVIPRTKSDAEARANAAMILWANNYLGPLENGYSQPEVNSWAHKGPAAVRYEAGEATTADTLSLQAEADALGQTVPELVARILPRAEPYMKATAFTSALRQKVSAQLAASDVFGIPAILDAAQIEAVDKAAELGLPL